MLSSLWALLEARSLSTTLPLLCPCGHRAGLSSPPVALPQALLCPSSSQDARPSVGSWACRSDVSNQCKVNWPQALERRPGGVGGVPPRLGGPPWDTGIRLGGRALALYSPHFSV